MDLLYAIPRLVETIELYKYRLSSVDGMSVTHKMDFEAVIAQMGAMYGVLIPKKYWDEPWFKKAVKLRKHKFSITITSEM